MGVLMLPSWTLETMQSHLHRLEVIQIEQLLRPEDDEEDERTKLLCVFLYATKSQRKFRASLPAKGHLQPTVKEITTFDRFIVLGVAGSRRVVVTFSDTAQKSRSLLQWGTNFRPGDYVWVIMPTVNSTIGTKTPEIKFDDPLIPTPLEYHHADELVPPPGDAHEPDYINFSFITKSLRIRSASILDKVCTGSLCDSQTGTNACACLSADSQKHWVVQLRFSCPELKDRSRTAIQLNSSRTTSWLVDPETWRKDIDTANVNPFDLDDACKAIVRQLNDEGGFLIKGWFKPALDENGVALEQFSIHVTYLMPNFSMNDIQKGLRYGSKRNCTIDSSFAIHQSMASTPLRDRLERGTSASRVREGSHDGRTDEQDDTEETQGPRSKVARSSSVVEEREVGSSQYRDGFSL